VIVSSKYRRHEYQSLGLCVSYGMFKNAGRLWDKKCGKQYNETGAEGKYTSFYAV